MAELRGNSTMQDEAGHSRLDKGSSSIVVRLRCYASTHQAQRNEPRHKVVL